MSWLDKVKAKSRSLTGFCGACGHAPTPVNRLINLKSGARIHQSHVIDPNSGFYGQR